MCDGVSELVREREAIFLTTLEPDIQVLDPAETRLVADSSPAFADSRLYLESLLRQAAPNDDHIQVAHGAAMDPAPYQFDPARQALRQPRQRILIADAVGLGKTLEAGILVSELIARGRGRRILVLAVKSMLTQFQKEFWNRFTIPLTRLDSIGIQRVRSRIPTSHNPFHYYDKAIISIDTLKQDAEYRTYLEHAYWDIIVIDEAHNVADRGAGGVSHGRTSLRSRLARLLARRSDTLIMLSATPHDGRARSFASLMNMLGATAIADPDNYTKDDFRDKGLVIRRFKKDIRNQVRDAFRDRAIVMRRFSASAAEEAAYEALLAVRVAPSRSVGTAAELQRRDLFLVTLEKALFSSPAACIASVDQRIRRRERELAEAPNANVAAEVESLRALRKALVAIGPDDYSKYQELRGAWLDELEEAEATQAFLNARQNYALLVGQKANLYKCFVPQAWMIGASSGVAGFLHPEGVYEDAKGGLLREHLYPRLRAHFQFLNVKKLFADVDAKTSFSVNIYGPPRQSPAFLHIANLFAPATVDASMTHDGQGAVPGIKDHDNDWNTTGHAGRVVRIDRNALDSFVRLYDALGTLADQARLPALHAGALLVVLRKLAAHAHRLGDGKVQFFVTWHWDETAAQRNGTIRRETTFPAAPNEMILSGPHIFVANPLNKTPRRECTFNGHYDVLDLTALPDDYLPRTNYVPACDAAEYQHRCPTVSWAKSGNDAPRPATDYYRMVNREMVDPAAERTLSPVIVPRGFALINTNVATVFRDTTACLDFTALSTSSVLDFFIKSTGTGHINLSRLSRLPLLADDCNPQIRAALRVRALRLNCLTTHYADLWSEMCTADLSGTADAGSAGPAVTSIDFFRADAWAGQDARLADDWGALPSA